MDERQLAYDTDGSLKLFLQACDEMDSERFDSAIELFESSNRIRPHYKTSLLLGSCLTRLQRHRDAIIPLAAATALNRQGIAPFELAKVFMTLDEPDRALEFVQLALERQPHLRAARELEPVIREAAERRLREICGD
jgi:tetratricopeptide (TPR) repeat protein